MNATTSADAVSAILEELIANIVARSCRRERRNKRVKLTCEGCSARAVEHYGYGGHPSQRRHMEYGGCLSHEYLNADSGVSSGED